MDIAYICPTKAVKVRSSRFVLVIRWTAAGRRGAGGGWVAAAVVAARVGRSRGAAGAVHRQGCVRHHAAQVPAVQGVHGQFIDRVLDISVAHREVPTVQTVQKTVLGVDVPVISSDSSHSPEVRILLPQSQFIL